MTAWQSALTAGSGSAHSIRLWAVIVVDDKGAIRHQCRVSLIQGVMDGLQGKQPLRKQIGTAQSAATDAEEKH